MERTEPDQRRKHDQRREHFAIGLLHLDGGRVAKALGKGLDEYFGNENKELETTADLIDSTIGLYTVSEPTSVTEAALNVISLYQFGKAANNFKNIPNNKSKTKEGDAIESSSNKTQESNSDLIWKPILYQP